MKIFMKTYEKSINKMKMKCPVTKKLKSKCYPLKKLILSLILQKIIMILILKVVVKVKKTSEIKKFKIETVKVIL